MRLHSLKLTFILLLGCFQFLAAQYTIPEKPKILYPVYDEAGLLNDSEKQQLNNKLIKFSDSTSTEIEVIIIASTKGEDVNFLATKFGEKWGIGQKGIDNGLVFLVAVEDRTMSIQQGRAVEQYLTASVAGQIIDYIISPNFRQGKYYQGIDQGTSALMEAVQGKFKPIAKKQSNNEEVGLGRIFLIIFIVLIILIIISSNGGSGGRNDDDVVLSRRGRRSYPGGFFPFPGSFGGGGFGGGSSGGGGFGGFGGGGSFGGGGASGGW